MFFGQSMRILRRGEEQTWAGRVRALRFMQMYASEGSVGKTGALLRTVEGASGALSCTEEGRKRYVIVFGGRRNVKCV